MYFIDMCHDIQTKTGHSGMQCIHNFIPAHSIFLLINHQRIRRKVCYVLLHSSVCVQVKLQDALMKQWETACQHLLISCLENAWALCCSRQVRFEVSSIVPAYVRSMYLPAGSRSMCCISFNCMLGGALTIIHIANRMSWREDRDDAKKPRQ